MNEALHRLASCLSDDKERPTCVLCKADYQGSRRWFVRIVGKERTSIQYGDDLLDALKAAITEVKA